MVYSSLSINNISAFTTATPVFSKYTFPVSPSVYLYAHFEHVDGTPAKDGTQGVSLTKLKILNTLIDQLSNIKQQNKKELLPATAISEDKIDALIAQYGKEFRSALASRSVLQIPINTNLQGTLVNLVA